jgi:DNA mismatch repair protein MutL
VAELLHRVGLEVEPFGHDVVRVTALPPELGAEAAGELLSELLERATALDGTPERIAETLEEALAASLSCRAAIKVNHPLDPAEQRALLADLAAADDPYRCPHGRPIVLRLGQDEMERRLGRR